MFFFFFSLGHDLHELLSLVPSLTQRLCHSNSHDSRRLLEEMQGTDWLFIKLVIFLMSPMMFMNLIMRALKSMSFMSD